MGHFGLKKSKLDNMIKIGFYGDIDMKKTLIENFTSNIKDGQFILTQRLCDTDIAIKIILDVAEDVTVEEYKVLKETMQILRKYAK